MEIFAENPHERDTPVIREFFGDLEFDPGSGRVWLNGTQVQITSREFDLALLLFLHLGRSVSRTLIRDVIWPGTSRTLSRTMDTHVCMIRKKLGLYPDRGYRLTSLYGYGYRLERIGRE